MKESAKRKDKVSCTILAKQVVRSRKAKERLHTSKAQLNSMVLQLQQMLGNHDEFIKSNVKSGWKHAKKCRNYEISQSFGQITANFSNNARNGHGNDKSNGIILTLGGCH
jgi:hypothetical protein